MKYAVYSNYKPSNIGWICDFPAHWEIKRLKYVANRAEVKVEADEDNPLPYVGLENVEPWTGRLINLNDELVPTGISNRFKAGDTLFGKLRPYLAKACNVDFDGLSSSELLVLRGQTYDRNFLVYQLLSHGFINLVDSSTYGSKMPRASWDFIGICELPQPPLDEQQAIARFLDAKTAQIDDLIAKKRQLIDKLKEKRSALIARTVTRGLPPEAAKAVGLEPHPEMKDSGVEWMGKVPEQWDVVRVKFVAQVESGHTPSRSEPLYWIEEECVIPWVSLNDSKFLKENDFIGDTAVKISAEGMKNSSAHLLPAGAVVFTRDASIGLTAITTVPAAVSQHVIAWIPGKRVFQKYLLFVFKVMQKYLDSLTFGSTLKTIGMTDIRRITMPVPTIFEQQKISEFLDCETAQIGELMANIESAITRLTEYRQALISSAVTGKIDVRETPTLPEAA